MVISIELMRYLWPNLLFNRATYITKTIKGKTMINAGVFNTLTIARSTDNGLYLEDSDHNEVLLPNRYVPENYEVGDQIEVFIYFDSEDRIVATTDRPKILLGEVAVLEVVGTTRFGAFLDWGLPKDLFVPKSNQLTEMRNGDKHAVTMYVDNVTGRLVATTKINKIVNNDEITLRYKQKVDIVLAQRRDRGFRVIINSRHWGMLYDNQIFSPMALGDTAQAYVYKIAEDGRIDVSLQMQGFDQVKVATDAVLELLKQNGGVLEFGDKSDPEKVQLETGMSKKVFKRAVGFLLRTGDVITSEYRTELLNKIDNKEQVGDGKNE